MPRTIPLSLVAGKFPSSTWRTFALRSWRTSGARRLRSTAGWCGERGCWADRTHGSGSHSLNRAACVACTKQWPSPILALHRCFVGRRRFGHYGLVYVKNAGLSADALEAFYASYLEFTDRPRAEKEALSGKDIWFQRGWTPPNTEQAVVAGGQCVCWMGAHLLSPLSLLLLLLLGG